MSVYFLRVLKGNFQGLNIPLRKFPMVLGSSAQQKGGITLNDPEVSGEHFMIYREGEELMVEDLSSTNGTFLDGLSVQKSSIRPFSVIRVGTTEITLLERGASRQFTIARHVPEISSRWGLLGTSAESGHDSKVLGKDIEVSKHTHGFDIQSLELSSYLESRSLKGKETAELLSGYGDIAVNSTLSGALGTLFKLLGQKFSGLQRGVIFTAHPNKRQLRPRGIHLYTRGDLQDRVCQISMPALERSLGQKKTLFLSAQSHPDPTREHNLIIPILHGGEVILLIHLEIHRSEYKNLSKLPLQFISALLALASPSFHNLILRDEIQSWELNAVNAMMTALEAKDTYTAGHSERVCRYSMAMADEMYLDRETKQLLMISALCHDVGKIGTPDHILKNSSSLSHEEYEEIKHHPAIGDKIIHHLPNYNKIMGGVRHHHERLDGTGYPDGLRGDEIPLFGRIVALSDAFDAMVSGRSYSGFLEDYDAVEKLSEDQDVFDPEVLAAFARAFDSGVLNLRTGTVKRFVGDSS